MGFLWWRARRLRQILGILRCFFHCCVLHFESIPHSTLNVVQFHIQLSMSFVEVIGEGLASQVYPE
jgi:hypothetical protein